MNLLLRLCRAIWGGAGRGEAGRQASASAPAPCGPCTRLAAWLGENADAFGYTGELPRPEHAIDTLLPLLHAERAAMVDFSNHIGALFADSEADANSVVDRLRVEDLPALAAKVEAEVTGLWERDAATDAFIREMGHLSLRAIGLELRHLRRERLRRGLSGLPEDAEMDSTSRGVTRVYVASRASLPARGEMWRQARATGTPIVSSWIDEDGPGQTPDMKALWARISVETQCSALVLYLEPGDLPLKGALVEVGMALAAGARIFVVAPGFSEEELRAGIGSWILHPHVVCCPTLEDALAYATETKLSPSADAHLALTRLNLFLAGHRSRRVQIEHPDRYGAGCWTVTLSHERGVTTAHEVSYWTLPEERGGWPAAQAEAKAKGIVFGTETEDGDPIGLPGTLSAALGAFEAGVFAVRPPT